MPKFNGKVEQIENTIHKVSTIPTNPASDTEDYPNTLAVANYVNKMVSGGTIKMVRTYETTMSGDNYTLVPNYNEVIYPATFDKYVFFIRACDSNTTRFPVFRFTSTTADHNFEFFDRKGKLSYEIPIGAIAEGTIMALAYVNTHIIWLNPSFSTDELITSETLPSALVVGKHYKLTLTAATTLTLPDTANDGDIIEVEYFNSGTASIRVQWCTVSSANTPTSAPILSNNLGTGCYATCARDTLHRARCVWSALAGKWTVDIELFGIKTK